MQNENCITVLTLQTVTGCLIVNKIIDPEVDGGYFYTVLYRHNEWRMLDAIVDVISQPSIFDALSATSHLVLWKGESLHFLHCSPLRTLANVLDANWA